jgi:hypothetical protein
LAALLSDGCAGVIAPAALPGTPIKVATDCCGFRLNFWPWAQIRDLATHTRPGPKPIVTTDPSKATDEEHQVVPFRPRASSAGGTGWRWSPSSPQPPAPPDLAKYEGGDDDDNYRHRMLVNVAALAVTIILAVAGGWLAIQIAELRKNQDCVLSGRRNCAPIDVKALER